MDLIKLHKVKEFAIEQLKKWGLTGSYGCDWCMWEEAVGDSLGTFVDLLWSGADFCRTEVCTFCRMLDDWGLDFTLCMISS